jgi:hypothetical protein
MHAAPETHWFAPLPEQLVRHAFALHTNGEQLDVDCAGQLPCPSQNA